LQLRAASTIRYLGRILGSTSPLRALARPGELRSRLVAAGEPAGLGLREWLALKALCAILTCFAAAPIASVLPGRLGLLVFVATPVAGFLAPDVWLYRLSRRRIGAALRDLPDMLDLLRVTIDAGMSPSRALGVVAAEFRGPLAQQWTRASTEVALGIPQDRALADLAARLPAPEISSFVQALARTRRHGVPLARVLAAQARLARDRRRQQMREQAARAGPKIQLAVALLLVPAVLLIVAAGLLAELQRSGLLVPI
jgi:tight adherence protein C